MVMTPEERFENIENLLNMVAGNLVLFHTEIQELKEGVQDLREGVRELKETQVEQAAQIDKHSAAIRDLIVVSRTLLDSQKEVTVQILALREAQRATDEKLRGEKPPN